METRSKVHPLGFPSSPNGDRDMSDAILGALPQWTYAVRGTILSLSEKEKQYQLYMSKETSLLLFAIVSIFGTVVLLMAVLIATTNSSFSTEYKLFVGQRALILVPLWLHLYAIVQKRHPQQFSSLRFEQIYIGDALMLTVSFNFGLYMYGMTTAEGCQDSSPAPLLMCHHNLSVHSIVGYISLCVLVSVLIKCRHLGVVIACAFIEFFFLTSVVYKVDPSMNNALSVVWAMFVHCAVVMDFEISSRGMYLLLLKSNSFVREKVMAENETVVMEMQSKELRFLIGNVAHDLKTPLQAFSYELEMMKSQERESRSSDMESILLLESTCSFMLMTINRAIDYTKVTSGIKLKPSMGTVNVSEVFDWVTMCVARTAVSQAVSIVVDAFPLGLSNYIITDKQWLMENVLCLISNAQKFTAHGSIHLIYSSVSKDEAIQSSKSERNDECSSMVMVEVIDDGIGISEDMQKTLFQPFKQAMRQAGGTGLGIYSLSKRVESLGGTCGVSSRMDGKSGARFWFTLPYRPDASVSVNPSCSRHIPLSQRLNSCWGEELKNMGIMLVEDSPLIQKTCARSFLREGIKVDIANNGLECVEKVMNAPSQYKILLMDVNMPLMDGLEATERLRQWERNNGDIESGVPEKRLLIIGVSANSDSQSRKEALNAGMDRFISKPLKMSIFKDCIAEFDIVRHE